LPATPYAGVLTGRYTVNTGTQWHIRPLPTQAVLSIYFSCCLFFTALFFFLCIGQCCFPYPCAFIMCFVSCFQSLFVARAIAFYYVPEFFPVYFSKLVMLCLFIVF